MATWGTESSPAGLTVGLLYVLFSHRVLQGYQKRLPRLA